MWRFRVQNARSVTKICRFNSAFSHSMRGSTDLLSDHIERSLKLLYFFSSTFGSVVFDCELMGELPELGAVLNRRHSVVWLVVGGVRTQHFLTGDDAVLPQVHLVRNTQRKRVGVTIQHFIPVFLKNPWHCQKSGGDYHSVQRAIVFFQHRHQLTGLFLI